jgi:hypothetical protein
MKTNIDQPMNGPSVSRTDRATAIGFPPTPTDPPERHFGWFSSYNEEWAAFVQQQSVHRTRSGFDHNDPVPRPRVWNCPPG